MPICADYGHSPTDHPTLGRACARCGETIAEPTRYVVVRDPGFADDGRWYERERFVARGAHGSQRERLRLPMTLLHLAPTGEFVTREDGARGEVYDAYEPSMRAVAAAEDEDARV